MDATLSSRFFDKLSFLGDKGKQQVLSYLTLLRARNYAFGTLDSLVLSIKRLVLHLPPHRRVNLSDNLSLTSVQDIDRFIEAAKSSGLSPASINISLSGLTEFFDFLREDGQMLHQPIIRRRHRLFSPSTLPKPMAEADLLLFFKVIDSIRDRLIFLLMLRCGLRVSEVASLSWGNIDLESGSIRIDNSKGQVDRIVYLAPDVEHALTLWQAHSTPSHLFPSRKVKSSHIGRGQIFRLMKDYLLKADIARNYSPHSLRHTFATQLLNAGVVLDVLKELMGHTSIQVTLKYTKLYESTKRQQYHQAMEKIERRQANLGRS